MEKDGWNEIDVLNWWTRTEDVDPRIPEDIALRQMKEITSKYTKFLGDPINLRRTAIGD